MREPTFRSSSSPRFGDGSLRPSRASVLWMALVAADVRARAFIVRAMTIPRARPLRPLARRAVAAPAASSSDRAGDASSSGTTGRLVDPTGDASRREKAPKKACKGCGGTGVAECRACRGTGALAAGGFHAKNHVDLRSVVGTNWTAHRRTEGWRHFEAVGKSPADKANGKPHATVLLAATCDRDVTVWVSVRELKDRQLWSAGWKQREDLEWTGDPNAPGGAVARPKAGTTCVKCMGDGTIPCERKGCAMGAERVRKQEEVVAKTERAFKRALTVAKDAAAEGDDDAADVRRRVRRQLRDMSRGKKEKKTMRRRGKNGETSASAANGEEDWGAFRRATRDEKIDAWMRGEGGEEDDDPKRNQ